MLQKVRKTLIGSSAQRSGTSKATKSYFESHEAVICESNNKQ